MCQTSRPCARSVLMTSGTMSSGSGRSSTTERSRRTIMPPLNAAIGAFSPRGSINMRMPRRGRPLVIKKAMPLSWSRRTASIAPLVRTFAFVTSVPSTSASNAEIVSEAPIRTLALRSIIRVTLRTTFLTASMLYSYDESVSEAAVLTFRLTLEYWLPSVQKYVEMTVFLRCEMRRVYGRFPQCIDLLAFLCTLYPTQISGVFMSSRHHAACSLLLRLERDVNQFCQVD